MKVENKLEFFAETAMREAEERSEAIKAETETAYKEECEKIRAEASQKSEAVISAHTIKIESEKNREITNALKEARIELAETEARLKEELKKSVFDRLVKFTETEEYKESLKKNINCLLEKHRNGITVIINPKDAAAVSELPVCTEFDGNITGGFCAKISGTNIFYDFSYNTRLDEEIYG